MSEWIACVPNELERDAVGLWQITKAGRVFFELTDDKLSEFIRQCLHALFAKGAMPVKSGEGEKVWCPTSEYGRSSEEMAEAIIAEWLSAGKDPEFYDSLWFALPDSPDVKKKS